VGAAHAEARLKHYEQRLQADLDAITARVDRLAHAVHDAVAAATKALLAGDAAALHQVALGDHPINREARAIDAECHAFVARHMPAAGPLRTVSSTLRLTIALERIGDYAVSVARVGVELDGRLPTSVRAPIAALSASSVHMLARAAHAFVHRDAPLAREVITMARSVDDAHRALFAHVLTLDGAPLADVIGLVTVVNKLERVSDQAKNICEEAVFAATGQAKAPKQYGVLFVDGGGGAFAPLAAALARRAYPESGRYAAGGSISADVRRFADGVHLDLDGAEPSLRDVHVIVALEAPGAAPASITTPFQTALVRWPVASVTGGTDDERTASVAEAARDLSARIRDLMELLRGPDAS
jgi:phosphate transport system protein